MAAPSVVHGVIEVDMVKRFIGAITAVVAIVTLSVWIVTQPHKTLSVHAVWAPPIPQSALHWAGLRETAFSRERLVYKVYYAWDGQRQEWPSWVVLRFDGPQWSVLETAGTPEERWLSLPRARFDERWINGGFQRIARTRLETLQHFVFGTDHAWDLEKRAFRKVAKLIQFQEQCEAEGKDLFSTMRQHLENHPEVASFWPDTRDHYDKEIRDLQESVGKEQGNNGHD